MSSRGQKVFDRLYGSATGFEDLPWHEPEPPPLLVKALDQRDRPGAALDIGCGAGTYSLYMAGRGYEVTAVDFMPQAVDMLRQRAAEAGLDIEVSQADINSWSTGKKFDVVLDVGCLHTPGTIDPEFYKQKLLDWLAPGGDFILTHFDRRGWWDRWPMGPSRVYRREIVALFEPELTLQEYRTEKLTEMPIVLGGSGLVGRYWFRR
jgi:SAM-dependent methyltransferase